MYIPRVLLLAHESKSVNYLTNLIIKRNNILSHSHCERRSVNYLLKNQNIFNIFQKLSNNFKEFFFSIQIGIKVKTD